MIFAVGIGLAVGLALGFGLDISYPAEYSFYVTMGLLAAMDSIVGAIRSMMVEKYNNFIFITGFITNALLAMVLTYVGDKLGVPLYFAAIFVFGGRLFNNLAVIRRIAIDKYFDRKNRQNELKNSQNIEE